MDRAAFTPGLPYQQEWAGGPPRRGSRADTGRRPAVATKVMAGIAVVLVAAAVGAGLWTLGHHKTTTPPRSTPSQSPSHSTAPAVVLTPASAAAFGPNGGDNGPEAPLAIDGQPSTEWTTDSYQGSPRFGNLYGGTGLVLNMGKQVSVSSVTIAFGQAPGSHVRIEVGDSASGTKPAGTTTLGHSGNAYGTMTFTAHHAATGQYVFIWFTKLAQQQGSPGHYQADVFNIVVKGSP